MTTTASSSNTANDLRQRAAAKTAPEPHVVLVIGATGGVGRRVVTQLLDNSKKNYSVRALVRNKTKAQQIFSPKLLENPRLELIVMDLGNYDDCAAQLEAAIQGCSAVLSVVGDLRLLHVLDILLPWRLFATDASQWTNDRSHPYYCNYQAHLAVLRLAEKHKVKRLVRLTGISQSLTAFHPFVVLMNIMLSMTMRYHKLTERAFQNSKIPFVIVRPGLLVDEKRNATTTHLQVEPSGYLPPIPPSKCTVGRDDVAALCVASIDDDCECVKNNDSHVLACRWVPKTAPGGHYYADAAASIQALPKRQKPAPSIMRRYGVAVACVVYPLLGVALWATTKLCMKLMH